MPDLGTQQWVETIRQKTASTTRPIQSITSWVPSAEYNSTIVRFRHNGVDNGSKLINPFSSVISVHIGVLGTEMPPLKSIYWTKIVLFAISQTDRVQVRTRGIAFPNLHTRHSGDNATKSATTICVKMVP